MTAHGYTVHIFKSSATSLSTSLVAYTFNTQLASVPEPASPVIRPLEGRAEAQAWSVSVVDSGSTVTGILADSTGRFHLLNRLLGVRRTVDGSTAAWLGIGRIANVALNANVAAYDLTVDDEHRLARNTDIFTTNTTRLYPAGPNVPYGPFLVPDPATFNGALRTVLPSSGTQALVTLSGAIGDYDALVTAVTGDRIPWNEYRGMNASTSRGNYEYLRLRVWSSGVTRPNDSTDYTDCPVLGFPEDGKYTITIGGDPSIGITEGAAGNIADFKGVFAALPQIAKLRVLVLASTTVVPSAHPALNRTRYAVLHAMGKPPSDVMPLHIGGITGKHPAVIAKAVYDGEYSTASARLPRYSSTAMTSWQNDARFPLMRFRVTQGPQAMARWLEDNVYAPNLIAPVTDAQGRIAPKSMLQPQSSGVVGYTFTGANLREPHPSFANASQDQVTVAAYDYTHEMAPKKYMVWLNAGTKLRAGTRLRAAEPSGYGGDLIAVESRSVEQVSRSSVHGRNVVGYAANGWHTETLPDNPGILQSVINTVYGNKALTNARLMAGHVLDRFADGAVTGTLAALSTAESVQPGDYVKVTLGSYPNAETLGRGGSRIVQILSRQDTPHGPVYEYLDAGPSAQPTTAPSVVTVSAGPAGSTKHAINVAVGGIAGRAYVQMAFGSTRPPAGSTRWEAVLDTTSTAAQTVGSLPAGTTIHARAWNLRRNRFASSFTYSSKRATAALGTPTSFKPSTVGTNYAVFGWGNAEELPLDLFVDPSTTAAFTSTNRAGTVGIGVTNYTFVNLTSNSTYRFGARHRDIYGGVGPAASYTTWTKNTTAGLRTAPTVTLSIISGDST